MDPGFGRWGLLLNKYAFKPNVHFTSLFVFLLCQLYTYLQSTS